jgi:glycosyltransferase involved in cell wall biosynthesis
MKCSVVIPTLNGRDHLATSLDALAAHAPACEVIVVNGPSADGTTGMVQNRDDVAVLLEISERTPGVALNAGINMATGDAIAFLNHDLAVESGWQTAVIDGLTEAVAVTGPIHQTLPVGMTTTEPESTVIGEKSISLFNMGNVAFRADILNELDGFDEYLDAREGIDLAHRINNVGETVSWEANMGVRTEFKTDGGIRQQNRREKYRALAYTLMKNYGLRFTTAKETIRPPGQDALTSLRATVTGEMQPTTWIATGRDVLAGLCDGIRSGAVARVRDRSSVRNPNGCSARADRVVACYDWR